MFEGDGSGLGKIIPSSTYDGNDQECDSDCCVHSSAQHMWTWIALPVAAHGRLPHSTAAVENDPPDLGADGYSKGEPVVP